jgi:peptide-methionine (S)-S-oxide reductase
MKNLEVAIFGGGCFWCTEAVFKMIKGVESVLPGYSGGDKPNPTYHEVADGESGYVEVVKVEYDSSQVSFRTLLTVFFGSHDPTTRDRQGPDVGSQYKSTIFYTSEDQKREVEKMISEINLSSPKGRPVVTMLLLFKNFYEAESVHKNYYERNKGNTYCELIINPKLEKVQREYGDLLSGLYKSK